MNYEKMSRKELVSNCIHCEKEQLQYETELAQLKEKCAEYVRQLEIADNRLREMQANKEITMREMIIALKPIMWVTQELEKWKGKG